MLPYAVCWVAGIASSALAFRRLLPWTMRYSAGNTIRVKSVDEIMPPMTTVASGRCTSEPAMLLSLTIVPAAVAMFITGDAARQSERDTGKDDFPASLEAQRHHQLESFRG